MCVTRISLLHKYLKIRFILQYRGLENLENIEISYNFVNGNYHRNIKEIQEKSGKNNFGFHYSTIMVIWRKKKTYKTVKVLNCWIIGNDLIIQNFTEILVNLNYLSKNFTILSTLFRLMRLFFRFQWC